jgi:hypothetical protein
MGEDIGERLERGTPSGTHSRDDALDGILENSDPEDGDGQGVTS